MKQKIIVAVSGASGAIYAKQLIEKLSEIDVFVELVFTDNAMQIWKSELKDFDLDKYNFTTYTNNNFYAPFASGSAKYNAMIIIPSSMGIIGRIANGISNDLITRAADVSLKERRKLIIVPRETPYSLIHLENLKKITLAGGIICPASPSFYSNPKNITELVDTVVDRILDLAGINIKTFRWGDKKE